MPEVRLPEERNQTLQEPRMPRGKMNVPKSREGTGYSASPECPECLVPEAMVIDVRRTGDGRLRRRRVCPNGHRYSTYETRVDPIIDYQI